MGSFFLGGHYCRGIIEVICTEQAKNPIKGTKKTYIKTDTGQIYVNKRFNKNKFFLFYF